MITKVNFRKSVVAAALIIAGSLPAFSQSRIIPLDFDRYRLLEKLSNDRNTRLHTSMKPFFVEDSLATRIDSLLDLPSKRKYNSWFPRKLFNEHLVEFRKPDYSVNIDFLPDVQTGRDSEGNKTIWTTTAGAQAEISIGSKVYIYSSYFENQSAFPAYVDRRIVQTQVVPGQGQPSRYQVDDVDPGNSFDYPYATGYISYTPNKYLNLRFGQDKNFIGDGYRSMLLSDVSFNYPFLKLSLTLDNVRYMAMWAQFQDPSADKFSYSSGFRKKWGVFHYLDWNITNRFTAGFFDAVIWQDADENAKRGFDFAYLNPFSFLRPVEYSVGSPDNALIGFNFKYIIGKNVTAYAQVALDEYRNSELFSSSGWWANKYGLQFGLKAYDLFNVEKLNILAEFNTARPYTYSARNSLQNYGHFNEALAHPLGANFREYLGKGSYQLNRWMFNAQLQVATYGQDPAGANFGKNIMLPYDDREMDYNNRIGQGIRTNVYYGNLRLAYLFNPKYNLRIEGAYTGRRESSNLGRNVTSVFTIGLKSAFRNLYYDF